MTRAVLPCPEPGIYPDVPAHAYHAWDAPSNSALNRLQARTPMHARHALDNPADSTPAQVRGDALHLAVLEPHLFADRYVVAGDCAEPIKTGPRAGQPCGNAGSVLRAGVWRCGTHDKGTSDDFRTVISADDHARCMGMRDAVVAHPDAANLLAATERRELSIVFDWPRTKIRCKARIDVPAFEAGVLGDVKTTPDAGVREFARSIAKYGYHRQAPFYMTGCEVLGHKVEDFLFVAVESDPPHGCSVFRLTDGAVSVGRDELTKLLATWDRCRQHGEWPGYPRSITEITLPDWAWNLVD